MLETSPATKAYPGHVKNAACPERATTSGATSTSGGRCDDPILEFILGSRGWDPNEV